MISFNLDISIHRPIHQVFEFVTSPANNNQWQYGTFDSMSVPGLAAGLGSVFRTIGHFMGRRLSGTFEVTDFEANRKYGFKSVSGPVQTRTLFNFEVAGLFTRILVQADVESTNYFQSNEQTIAKKLKKQFKENLEHLKTLMETK